MTSAPLHALPRSGPPAAGGVPAFAGVSAGLAAALAATGVLGAGIPQGILPVGCFLPAAALALAHYRRDAAAVRLGPANVVTLLRLALAALLAAPLADPALMAAGAGWAVFALALVTLALDGIDGRLARRSGLATRFGARFDMEVDAAFALLLGLLAWRAGAAGPWVLLLAGMRYPFAAAGRIWPWLAADLPHRLRRKAICVIQIATLTGLLAPVALPPWTTLVAALALTLLAASFAADILWLWRRR